MWSTRWCQGTRMLTKFHMQVTSSRQMGTPGYLVSLGTQMARRVPHAASGGVSLLCKVKKNDVTAFRRESGCQNDSLLCAWVCPHWAMPACRTCSIRTARSLLRFGPVRGVLSIQTQHSPIAGAYALTAGVAGLRGDESGSPLKGLAGVSHWKAISMIGGRTLQAGHDDAQDVVCGMAVYIDLASVYRMLLLISDVHIVCTIVPSDMGVTVGPALLCAPLAWTFEVGHCPTSNPCMGLNS